MFITICGSTWSSHPICAEWLCICWRDSCISTDTCGMPWYTYQPVDKVVTISSHRGILPVFEQHSSVAISEEQRFDRSIEFLGYSYAFLGNQTNLEFGLPRISLDHTRNKLPPDQSEQRKMVWVMMTLGCHRACLWLC